MATRKDFRNYLHQKDSDLRAHQKDIATIKECYKESRPIPHHLREKAKDLMDEIIFDSISPSNSNNLPDFLTSRPKPIHITTSRDPSSKLKQFVKHLALIFNATPINRGSMTVHDLHNSGLDTLMIVGESKGMASSLILTFLPHGPTFHFSIHHVTLTSRIKSIKAGVNLVLSGFKTEIGLMVKNHLSVLFPADHKNENHSEESKTYGQKFSDSRNKRTITFHASNDLIRVRHFHHDPLVVLDETFKFDLKLYRVTRGTVEMGETVYSLNTYSNAAGKNDIL